MMKTIRKKITVCLMATVLVALVAVGTTSITLNYRSTLMTVEQLMTQTANLAGERVEQELLAYRNVAMDTGRVTQLSDPEVPVEEKKAIIDERVSLHGFQRGNVIGADGISIFDGKDYSDREYVHKALEGTAYVSEPLISKVTGELSIMVAAPLYSDSGEIAGVVYFVPPETFLNDIVSSIQVGQNCRAYMINKNGDTIADITLDTITKQNVEREAASDPSLKSRAALHEAMRRGENGFGRIEAADGPRFLAYAPVGGTDGWSVAVASPESNYLSDTYFGMLINVLVIVISILASIVVALKLSSNISKPMRACARRMKLLVEGDLESPAPEVAGRDETAELTRSTGEMVQGLNIIIHDIDYLLNQMANQNFDIVSSHREAYVGDFQSILSSMRNLKLELSSTIRQIDASAGQVSSASGQVSNGAQALSQGTMEQASSVQELAATIMEISESAKRTSAAAEEAGEFVNQAGAQLGVSVGYVEELNTAMGKISDSSQEISKIIETIENIAFQTNILALNAAVEAARAGTAGKGFAVVADEVRNLANKSDQAAKATKSLIETSIAAVEEGSQAVGKVTGSLEQTSVYAGHVTEQMDVVVEAVEKQTDSITQVTEGVEQISSVVQTNSATAEESAAASQELSAEANSLKQLVENFTLASE
ncbi:methyl-accepting chemotaxis protein [Acutalibacter muris]|jgi:methyl-accepting chemotaxis protein|uniref:methyl-accepting chemotaxis protein n=1 Tax=Acutalibacter muris TaxID=1796620 RepID=UPI002ED3FC49